MQVHLIKKKSIHEFIHMHGRSKSSFLIWLETLKHANWNDPNDLFATFPSADILGNSSNRIVFNVGGNAYRIICKFQFTQSEMRLYVKWIGTHDEYSQLCKQNKQYHIDQFRS